MPTPALPNTIDVIIARLHNIIQHCALTIAELGQCLVQPKSGAVRSTIRAIRMFEKQRVGEVIRLLGV